MEGRAVREVVRAGQEDVRRVHGPGLVLAGPAKAVDFSNSYYFVNQAVVGIKGAPITKAKSLAALKPFTLGAAIGTTSYNYITRYIRPSEKPKVYDTNNDAVTALKNKQIDGLVVDFPSTGYITGVQVPTSTVVGRLPTKGTRERFGMVFEKGSTLDSCVNQGAGGDASQRDAQTTRVEVARRRRTAAEGLASGL